MKHFALPLALALILTLQSAAAAAEHYFTFNITDRQELEEITRLVSISSVKGNVVFAYANDEQLRDFERMGYSYTKLSPPGTLGDPAMAVDLEDMAEWDRYPSYDQYIAMMQQFAADYPDLCQVTNIGYTVEGRQLLFARISDNVGVDESEPEVMYTSTMHGDETAGYILMLRLIDSLLVSYGIDPEVTAMVDNFEIWINPLANPDGTYNAGDNSVYGATRFNANYVDLNRNFPDPGQGDHPDGNEWQPETIAMMNFAASRNIVLSANFHGGAEVVNYPWDSWERLHADDAWYWDVSRDYADTAQAYSPTGYMDDHENGIVRGYEWYIVYGGRQDYMNYWHGCREVTVELSTIKLVAANTLPSYWEYNRRSLFNYLRNAYYGVRGIVTDSETGLPVMAQIFIPNHDIDNSMVYSDSETGNYYRLIAPGTYELRFSAEGYAPHTTFNVVVDDGQTTVLNIQLDPYPEEYVCGDANGDGETNPIDAAYLVSYFYWGGPAPVVPDAVDVDGSGDVSPLDLLYLVNYLYLGGPAPDCPS